MRAALFDFGGTLDTDGVHWSEKFWDLYQKHRIAIPKAAYEKAFIESDRRLMDDPAISRATFHETLRKQLTLQFSILGLGSHDRVLSTITDDCYNEVQLSISRAKTILAGLKAKYKLALVSNFYGNLDVVCREFGLDRLFDAAVDSVVVGIKKPDPAIFGEALKQLHVTGREAYVVGDSYERDIVPGKSLGCTTIWLKGKSWTMPASTEAADHIIDSFQQIKKLL